MIVKPFLIVSATSFNFAVMPRCSRMNRFVMYMKLCAQPVKGVILGVFDVLQNSLPLSVGMISGAYPKERIARFIKSTAEYPLCSL